MSKTKILLCVVLAFVVVLGGCFTLAYSTGMLDAQLTRTVGKAQADAKHDVFKSTTTYVEGKIEDLSRYRLEMKKSSDAVTRAAIAEHVNSEFANFDSSQIEDSDLREFLDDCLDGEYIIKDGGTQ